MKLIFDKSSQTWVSVSVVGSVGGKLEVLAELCSVLSDGENSADVRGGIIIVFKLSVMLKCYAEYKWPQYY